MKNVLIIFSLAALLGSCQSPKFISESPDDSLRIPADGIEDDCLRGIDKILRKNARGKIELKGKIVKVLDDIKAIDYKIPRSAKTKVKDILEAAGVSAADAKKVKEYNDAIQVLYKTIRGNTTGSMTKSDKMAKAGKKLRALYSKLDNPETVRDLDFFLGKAVIEAESYVAREFKKVDNFIMDRNKELFHINYPNFKKYFLSSEKGGPPYSELDLSGWKIIERHQIREIQAHNYFPMYIGHDMTHVKYSVSHERYFPMLFGAARSKNNYRYALMGALGEAVDTTQYSEESTIAEYFDKKLKLTLEEGMMYIARLDSNELKKLAEDAEIDSAIDGIARGFANWKPERSATYPGVGVNGASLEEDNVNFFNTMRMLHVDEDMIPYFNDRKSAPLY